MPIPHTVKCPKCGYTKQVSDGNPLAFCPKCKVRMSATSGVILDAINTLISAIRGKK